MARRRKNSVSDAITGWGIIGAAILGIGSFFSDDKPSEPIKSPETQQVQPLMQTASQPIEPVKSTEKNVPQTTKTIVPVVTSKSNIDHSDVPVESVAPKKSIQQNVRNTQSSQSTKFKSSKTETVTYLKNDGASPTSQCGSKRLCKQMSSCAEARFYLNQCGLDRLDRDGDGVPCESLCLGKKKRR